MEALFTVLLVIILVAIGTNLRELAATHKRKQAAERAAPENRDGERKQETERQEDYAASLVQNCQESRDNFEPLRRHLLAAEESLDEAETRFREGAFALFWDSIEQAVRELGNFDTRVQSITSRLIAYNALLKQPAGQPPQFFIDGDCVAKLAASARTAERLRSIVYKAQCNTEFAAIYEQRRTRAISIAGFATLANALALMSSQLQTSVGQLASSAGPMTPHTNDSSAAVGINPANPAPPHTHHHQEVIFKLKSAATQLGTLARGFLADQVQYVRRRLL